MADLNKATSYKYSVYGLIAVFSISSLMILATIFMYFHAGIKMNRQQQIGKRVEKECGLEVTEIETERYFIYNLFEEQSLRKLITNVIILLRTTIGLMIVGVLIVYGFWMYFIFCNENEDTPKYTMNLGERGNKVLKWLGFWKKDNDYKQLGGSQVVGWSVYIILFALLFTAAAGSWTRAFNASKYSTTMMSSDETKTVTDLTNEIEGTLSQTRGIDSPWFSIVLIIVYGLFWAWASNDVKDPTTKMSTGARVENGAISWWVFTILLYFFASFAVLVVDKDTRTLFANLSGSYAAKKRQLQENIIALLDGNTNAKQYFKTTIELVRTGVQVLADSIGTSKDPYTSQLWKYIQHKSGNEMEEFYNNDNKSTIGEIRKWALALRMSSTAIADATSKFSRHAIMFPMIILVVMLFMLFNFISHAWSSTSMAVGSLLLVVGLTVVATWFGWFSSALLL